jgi:thymidine kinase
MLARESIRILHPMTYLFTGPMEAGKTYHLMRKVQTLLGTPTPLPFNLNDPASANDPDSAALTQDTYTAAIFCKPKVDTRSNASTIASRNGTSFQGVQALDSLDPVEFEANTLIAVDEAQFFDASLLRLFDRVQETPGCTMVVAGLDRDYLQQPFGHVLELAQKITTSPGMGQVNLLRAPCHVPSCQAPAAYTSRIVADTTQSQILIGSAESYVPACAVHHTIQK